VSPDVPPVPAEAQLEATEADLVPTEADQGTAEAQLVPAEADLVPAETPLVSTRARPADTACKRAPLEVMEDSGPVLPSKREAGATAVHSEATRTAESPWAPTFPRSHAGMPAAAGEELRKPRGAKPSSPRKRCDVAGQGGWEN
jgi:hypothetical protein